MNDELKKLYDTLVSKGYYTNSYEEFIVKYEDPQYRDKVFGVVTRDGLYTKGREEFDVKYAPLKKKEEPSEVSFQEEQLASPMETPTLASLPGRDLTLPPSPRLAPQTQQAIQEAGGVAPQEQPIPVPYETRPTEVVTEEGITMDLETGAIAGEEGISPEAQAVMEGRIEEGAVEMPQPEEIKAPEVPTLAAPFVAFNQVVKGLVKPKEDKSELLEPVEVTAGEWVGDKWNGLIEGFGNWVNNIREENSLNGQVIARFIEDKKDKHPDLYVMYKKAIDDGYSDALAANAAYMEYFATVDKGIENEVLPYIKEAGREEIIKKAGYAIDKRKERELQDRFFSGAVRGLMTSLPAMATSASTMGLSFMDMSYQAAEEQLANELAANPDLQMTEAQRQTYLLATAGIEGILERVGLRNTLNGMPMVKRILAGKVLTRLAGMGEDVGAEAFERVVRQEAKGLRGYASKITKGGLSEFETGALQELSNDLINQYVTDSQGKNIFKPKTAQEIVMDVLYAGAQEAIGGGIIAGTVGAFSRPEGVTSEDFKQAKEFVGAIKREKVSEYIDQQVAAGKMERAEGDRVIANVDEFIDVLGKIPEDMPEEAQAEMFNLVREKQLTLEKVAGKDDAVQSIAKEKVAKIDEKIKELYTKSQEDAIQEQATSEVPVQPEARVGEEVAEGAPQAEPEVAPEARVEEEVTLTEEEQQQLEDLKAEALGQAPVAAATNEEVAAVFEGGRKLSDNLVVNETGAQPLTKEQTRIEKLAVRGAKAIQKLLPDVKIILHATGEEFSKNTGTAATDEGAYNDGVIHINLATADASTVAHEVFHAIFLNKVRTDSKAQAVAKTMMENVRKTLADDSALAKEIDAFAQNYDENFQNEERLAQLMGALSREYVNATSTVKGQIVEFIKRLARAFNVSLPSEFGKTDESVTAMLDVLARKVARGKAIVAADLVVLDSAAEPGSTVASGTVAENINEKGSDSININATRKQQLNRGGIDIEAIKRGSINDLSGANAFVFAADQATYGEIESPSGTRYFFKGGYLYPYSSGMGWAFTSETAANKILKKVKESDGVGLVMSQASDGIAGSLSFYEYLMAEIQNAVMKGASPQELIDYVNAKLRTASRTPGVTIAEQLEKKGHKGQIETLEDLRDLMPIEGKGVISYDTRGAFTKSFFSATSYERFGIPPLMPTAKMKTGVLDYVNDPSLEKVQYGDIISAIQFNKDSKVIDTRKEGMDTHPSYPFVIEGTPIMVFDKAVDVRKVYPKAKPVTGPQIEIGERAKPQAARSAMGAQYVAEIPTDIVEEPTVITLEDALPAAQLTGEQQMAIENIKVKKPALRQKKAMTNEEARESLNRKGRKPYPTSTDDALTADEVRVYFMDEDFNWRREFYQPYNNVANLFAEMANDPDFHIFPSIIMRGGFMTMDTSVENPELEMNIRISPKEGNVIYIDGIELFDPRLAGTGAGTRLMNRITAAADKLGLTIKLDAYPTKRYQGDPVTRKEYSEAKLAKMAKDLTKFYEKFGFSVTRVAYDGAQSMKRSPQTLETKNAMRQKKGLITITPTEGIKYQKAGIQEKYQQEAIKMLGEILPVLEDSGRFFTAMGYKKDGVEPTSEEILQASRAEGIVERVLDSLLFDSDTSADVNRADVKKTNLKDVNAVILLANRLFPKSSSPAQAVYRFLESIAFAIGAQVNQTDSYIIDFLKIYDGDNITKDILGQAKEADRMGLSRKTVAEIEEKAESDYHRMRVLNEYQVTQDDTIKKWAAFLQHEIGIPPAIRLMLFDAVVTHNYDARTGSYKKRNRQTLRNYTPYDEGTISRMVGEQTISSDAVLKEYVETMMANAPNVVKAFKMYDTAEGTWLKFPGGDGVSEQDINDNADALSQLVQDTPWCTKTGAEGQLRGGDFYVFVTTDKGGVPKARIAVRTRRGSIEEVRGILEGQQMEPKMRPVAEQFLESGAVPGGEKWAEGQRFNEKIRMFREEISKRPLTLQDFRTVSSLTAEANRYSFMQYGGNGFVERLNEDFNLKIDANDVAPEIKGKVARGMEELTPETEVLIGNFYGDNLIRMGLKAAAIEAMRDGKQIGSRLEIKGKARVFELFGEAINNEDPSDYVSHATDYVVLYSGGSFTSFDIFASLVEAYGEEGAVRMVSNAISNSAKSLRVIAGHYNQQSQLIPANLKTVEGDATIYDKNSTGNIELVGGDLFIQENSLDFHIGVTSVDQGVHIVNDIRSLGNLTTVQDNVNLYSAGQLESLGKLERVGDNLDLSYAQKLMSLGELKVVEGDLNLPPSIITLGKMKRLGRFEYGVPDTLESFGELEEIVRSSPIVIGEKSRLRDLGKLKKLEGSLQITDNKTLRTLGPHLKEIVGSLRVRLGDSGFDLGALETVNYLTISASDDYAGHAINLGSLRSVSGEVSINVEVDSFGDLEYVGGGLQFKPSENFKDTGKLKTVASGLLIWEGSEEGPGSTPIVISNLVTVGGSFFSTSSRVKSLGSIEEIAGDDHGEFISSVYLESSGNLLAKSVDPERYSLARKELKDGFISQELFNDIQRLHGEYLRAEAGVEPPPAIRQKRGDATAYQNWSAKPQSQAQELGHRFNMNHKGFVPATTDPAQFRIAVRKLDDRLGTKPRRDERTGEVSGYHMTLDGKFFNPFLRVIGGGGSANSLRRQGYGAGTQSIYEFINDVRERGYTDRVIAAFLKEQGYSATEIKSALAVPIDVMGTMLPDGFANAEGGVAQGQAFFNELTKKIKRYANAKRLGVLLHNAADVRAKAQELLVNSDFFKAQSPTIQAEMQIGLDKALNIPAANKKFQADFKALRAMLSNMKKGAAELEKAKRAMRMFIRKNLPKTVFNKADVNKLMKAITDATPDSLPAVMERVTGFVNEFYVRDLSAAIDKLLKTPTTRMVSGRRVGRVSVSLQNILGSLTNKKSPMLVDEGMSAQNIEDLMQKQEKRFNKLSVKTALTQEESDEMNALSIALMYNEAMLMEDNNPHKVDALAAVRDNLRTLISTGRSQMRGEIDAQRAYYEHLISDAYNGITGEELDLSEEGEEANKEKLIELKNKEQRRKTFDGGIKSFVGKIKNSVDEFFTKQMDLALLLQRISSGLSEAMGGNKLMEIFDDRLFKARVSFVSGKKQVFDIISNKAKEIWGDNYKLEMQRNAVPVVSKDLINDKNVIWLNEEKANELKKEYDSATNKRKAQIIRQLEKLEVVLSNNQAYYLYNQYKDPANVASFEKKFGKNQYARIMQQITDRLDAKTKEWADWQVNELYPSLYEKYNEVYKAIYRTNMPWNQFYAGRIFREGEEGDLQFDLLAGSSEYQTSVGGQSTKARVKNSRPIQSVDGNSVLNSYLKDMEYFRAYAEAMRDLSKVLDNANVKAAIIELGGKNTYDALKDMMQKVARKGISQNESQLANAMMGMYIKSKLAINPTVFLKQLTSAFAFADYIGYTNWSKYTALALPQARKLWKEWYANSPLFQERYENSNIGDILEGYSYEGSLNESPILVNKKVGGKDITVTKEQTRNLMNSLMYLVKQGDKGGIMGGLANYLYYKQQYLEKNPGDEAGAQKYASEKATKQALRTQQDSGITNKDWFQTGGPAYRFLNVFLSSPKALLRREMSAFMSLSRKMKGLPTQDGYGDIARRVVTYHILVPMVFQWVALGLPGLLSDWDEEDEQALGRAALLGNLNALFIVGDILTAVKDLVSGAPWAGEFTTLPVFEQIGLVFKDIKSFTKATDPVKKDKYMWRMINHITELTGIPASNIHKMVKNIEAIPDSKDPGEALLRLFNYSDYVIEGGDKKKSDKEIEAYRKAMLGE